jgi:hypothetical protein
MRDIVSNIKYIIKVLIPVKMSALTKPCLHISTQSPPPVGLELPQPAGVGVDLVLVAGP